MTTFQSGDNSSFEGFVTFDLLATLFFWTHSVKRNIWRKRAPLISVDLWNASDSPLLPSFPIGLRHSQEVDHYVPTLLIDLKILVLVFKEPIPNLVRQVRVVGLPFWFVLAVGLVLSVIKLPNVSLL